MTPALAGILPHPRYLIALPGNFAPLEGGTIGAIEKLDTRNPEMVIEWPEQVRSHSGRCVAPLQQCPHASAYSCFSLPLASTSVPTCA